VSRLDPTTEESPRAVPADSEEMKRVTALRTCGGSIQLAGALLLIAGASGFIVRIATGAWPEFLGYRLSQFLSPLLTALVLVSGIAALGLGQRIKRGSVTAAKWFSGLAWISLLVCVGLLWLSGRGTYEVLLFAFLAVDSTVAVLYARR